MNTKSLPRLLFASLILLALYTATHAQTGSAESPDVALGEFELDPTFRASEILEAEMISGDHFRVREEVDSDGYWDIYTVDTKFGVFTAHGWVDLRNLIREINAIAILDELSRTRIFIESAIDRGLEPIDFAAGIVRHPIETVRRIPRGIGNMFRRFAETARALLAIAGLEPKKHKNADLEARLAEACARGDELPPGLCDEKGYGDDVQEFAEKVFNVDDARRQWHEELGTDPYSTNQVLQEAISEVSWFDGLGEAGFKLSGLHGSNVIRVTSRVYKLAWRKDPNQLRKHVVQELQSLAIDEEQIKYFLHNPYISPTRQAFIVESLNDLEGVEGREGVLRWTAGSLSEDEALFSATTVALIAWFHTQTPIRSFLPNTLLPIVETADGRVVALLAIDELSWTQDVASIMTFAMQREDKERIKNEEAWLLGRASAKARAELEARDWKVLEEGYKAVLASGETLELDEEPDDTDEKQ